MAFLSQPPPQQLEQYIDRRFDAPTAAKLKACLNEVGDVHGDQRTLLQAAILIEWEGNRDLFSMADEADLFQMLESAIRIVNNDPRDFLCSFEGPPFWQNRFM